MATVVTGIRPNEMSLSSAKTYSAVKHFTANQRTKPLTLYETIRNAVTMLRPKMEYMVMEIMVIRLQAVLQMPMGKAIPLIIQK